MAGDGTHDSAMRWRCLGPVDVTCDKFDNRPYVLKTGYRFETGKLAYRLPF